MDDVQSQETTKKKRNVKKIILYTLFILFNIAVICYTAVDAFAGKPTEKIGIRYGWRNIGAFSLGVGAFVVLLAAETTKYYLMMHYLGEKKSWKNAFQVVALGKYYDAMTPTGAGGQPFQIWFLHSRGYSSGASAAMPLAGFMGMQFAFLILAIFFFIVRGYVMTISAIKATAMVGLLFYAIVPCLILLFIIAPAATKKIVHFFIWLGAKLHIVKHPEEREEKAVKSLEDYRQSLLVITKHKRLVILLMLLSLVYQLALCSIPYFILHGYGGKTTYFDVLTMTLYIYAAITIIPTPGNSGVAEASFYLVFSILNTAGVFWAMLVWRFGTYYIFIIIGLAIFGYNAAMSKKERKELKALEEESDMPTSPVTAEERDHEKT